MPFSVRSCVPDPRLARGRDARHLLRAASLPVLAALGNAIGSAPAHAQRPTPPSPGGASDPIARDPDGAPAWRVEDVLARAVAQSPLLDAARARVAAARGARRTAGTLPNPVFTYWSEGARFPGRPSDARFQPETQTYGTLPLEPLLSRGPRVRRADEDVRAAGADLARARQTVALDAARAFYRVAAAQVAVAATDDVRARLADLVTYTQARVREGRAAEADLIRTQVEVERLAADATLQRAELARARALLAPYLGPVGPGTPAGGADGPTVVVDEGGARGVGVGRPALPALPTLLATASATRPDVLAARARVARARADIASQRFLLVQQLGATFGSKRTLGTTSVIASVSVPLPLFDQNRGEVQRAAALRTAADDELAWAERQAAAEVRAAYDATQLLGAQVARMQGGFLGRAAESRQIALAAYREGAVTLLQVLDASRTLADVRQLYYRTLFAQRQSVFDLRVAAGLDPLGDPLGDAPGASSDSARRDTPATSAAPTGSPPFPFTPRPARVPGVRP